MTPRNYPRERSPGREIENLGQRRPPRPPVFILAELYNVAVGCGRAFRVESRTRRLAAAGAAGRESDAPLRFRIALGNNYAAAVDRDNRSPGNEEKLPSKNSPAFFNDSHNPSGAIALCRGDRSRFDNFH